MSRDFASRLSHLRRWRRNLISYSAIPFSTYWGSFDERGNKVR